MQVLSSFIAYLGTSKFTGIEKQEEAHMLHM